MRTKFFLSTTLVLAAVAMASTIGCSSSSDEGTPDGAATDSATDGGAAGDTSPAVDAAADHAASDAPTDTKSDGPKACNALVNGGSLITATYVSTNTPPPALGGTVLSGTYFLTAVTLYGESMPDAGADTTKTTVSISGLDLQAVDVRNGRPPQTSTVVLGAPDGGSTLDLTLTCPLMLHQTTGYTATGVGPGAQLIIYQSAKANTVTTEQTFVLQ